MAKTAKRKRKPKRPAAKRGQGHIVDLLDLPPRTRPETPAERRRGKKALENFLRKELEPAGPALKRLAQALQGPWVPDLGLSALDRMRVSRLPLSFKPRGDVEEPQQGKPAAERKAKARPDRARARLAILQLYPNGVPDTVSPQTLQREVANKLSEHEPAALKLPAPSIRTVQRARDSL